jgi:hypothetical protein
MPANTSPIFPLTANVTWVSGAAANAATPGVTANTTFDLTSGTIYGPVYTATTNGSRLDFLRLRPLGTNVQTVVRVWINNGSATGTAANNALFFERTLAATTVSQTTEQLDLVIPLNISLQTTYRVYLTFGTAVAAGFHASVVGGDY